MKHQQAISRLGKFHPQLSLLSSPGCDLADAMRIFDLKEGEKLVLKAFGSYDYLYILKGNATLRNDGGQDLPLQAGSRTHQRFMIPTDSNQIEITASNHVLLYQVDGSELDYLVALNEIVALIDPNGGDAENRARLVRNSKAFHRLPIESIAEAIVRLERLPVKAGEEIVTQGEPGDAYYIIEEGQAEVWELGIYDDEPKLVNELGKGEAFGEEALVMEGSRSATVRMTEDGSLLMLNKQDFDHLLKKEMVDWVDAGTAKSLVDHDHVLLDVRYEEEYEESYIPGSLLIPLQEIRQRYQELDPEKSYVAYCKGGKRSAVACMLLNQHNLDVSSLTGGIMEWPYEVVKSY